MAGSDMKYRDSVCAVVQRRVDGKVLVCHRRGFEPMSGWQFPQGGFDVAQGLIPEMKRELREEIGTDDVEVIAVAEKVFTYDFPPEARKSRPGYDGQRQRWVLACFLGKDSDINFNHDPAEFDAFEWVDPTDALHRIVDFKKNVYTQAMVALKLI